MKQYKSYYIYEAVEAENIPSNAFARSWVFNDYSTGEAVETNFNVTNTDVIESLANYMNYEFYDRFGDGNALSAMVRLWKRFCDNHSNDLTSMLSALFSEFNPLDNYNKFGSITDTKSGSDSVTGSTTNTRTDNLTDATTYGHTRTDNLKDSTDYDSTHSTTTTSHTDTHVVPEVVTTDSASSYESESMRETTKSTTGAVTTTDNYGNTGSTLTNDGNDSTTHTGTVTEGGSDSMSHTGTVSDQGTATSTTNYGAVNTIIDRTHGNIGTTMTTQMIQEVLNLRKYSFMDYLITYFVATNCFYTDGIDFADFR